MYSLVIIIRESNNLLFRNLGEWLKYCSITARLGRSFWSVSKCRINLLLSNFPRLHVRGWANQRSNYAKLKIFITSKSSFEWAIAFTEPVKQSIWTGERAPECDISRNLSYFLIESQPIGYQVYLSDRFSICLISHIIFSQVTKMIIIKKYDLTKSTSSSSSVSKSSNLIFLTKFLLFQGPTRHGNLFINAFIILLIFELPQ